MKEHDFLFEGNLKVKLHPSLNRFEVKDKVLVLNAAATGTYNDGDRLYIAGMRRPLIVDGTQATPTSINVVDPITEVVPITAAVTVIGGGAANGAIFDDRSLGFAMPLLDTPSDKPSSTASSNGYTVRIVQGYDMDDKTETLSLDCLLGACAYDPRRITLLREF